MHVVASAPDRILACLTSRLSANNGYITTAKQNCSSKGMLMEDACTDGTCRSVMTQMESQNRYACLHWTYRCYLTAQIGHWQDKLPAIKLVHVHAMCEQINQMTVHISLMALAGWTDLTWPTKPLPIDSTSGADLLVRSLTWLSKSLQELVH